jgi:hypothetical protein
LIRIILALLMFIHKPKMPMLIGVGLCVSVAKIISDWIWIVRAVIEIAPDLPLDKLRNAYRQGWCGTPALLTAGRQPVKRFF